MGLNVKLLRESFDLVIAREPSLTHRFYDNLFRLYPQAQPMFGRNSRAHQEKMLAEALVAVMNHLEDAPWLAEQLGAMGAKHAGYGVRDEMYAWVGDALITTLADVAGADWSHELSTEWTAAFGAIASLMKGGACRAHEPAVAEGAVA